jgi:hypothetical protein
LLQTPSPVDPQAFRLMDLSCDLTIRVTPAQSRCVQKIKEYADRVFWFPREANGSGFGNIRVTEFGIMTG